MVQAGSGGQYQPNPKEQHSAKWQLPEDWSSTSGQKSLMMVALLGSSAGFELQLLDDLLDLLWTYPYLSNIIIYTILYTLNPDMPWISEDCQFSSIFGFGKDWILLWGRWLWCGKGLRGHWPGQSLEDPRPGGPLGIKWLAAGHWEIRDVKYC